MAQNGMLAACKHSARLSPEGEWRRVSNAVDTPVHAVKPPVSGSVVDRVRTQAQQAQLPSADHPVLQLGEPGNRSIGGQPLAANVARTALRRESATFAALYAVNVTNSGASPRIATLAASGHAV